MWQKVEYISTSMVGIAIGRQEKPHKRRRRINGFDLQEETIVQPDDDEDEVFSATLLVVKKRYMRRIWKSKKNALVFDNGTGTRAPMCGDWQKFAA